MAHETMFEEMKRYVRFGEEDARLLAAFQLHATPHLPRIAAEFYDRIREHERAHNVLSGEEQITRLQQSLVRWMNQVLSGPHDEGSFEETSKIGRMHVRIGLEQRYMFTAMALIRVALERIADDTMSSDAKAVRGAIHRALDLELAIMLEAYRDDFIARLRHIERLQQERDQTPQRAEERYVHAVEIARVLIVGLDREGHIRLFNREAERVTGFARDEVMGERFDERLGTELGKEQCRILSHALTGQLPSSPSIDGELRTRVGKLRNVTWQLGYVPDDAPGAVVLFAIGRDVTDEKELAMRARQSEKLAAVGTLAAGLAHEIRNPLNGAQLHVTFLDRALRRAGADAESLEAVRVIGEEIKRLGVLVTEFLDFARPRPLYKKPTSIRSLCERVVSLTAPAAAQSRVDIDVQLPATDVVLDLDGSRMEQVVLNIVQNAIEALEHTGGRVSVRARRQPREVVIEVEDDGPGLPHADAPIFDPFYSTKPSGTGLGLSIVHRIVTDHDGTIDVESIPGKTVFRIALPAPLARITTDAR